MNTRVEPEPSEPEITPAMVRETLGSALVCDALDAEGCPHQSPRIEFAR